MVISIYGGSGSGKTTLATALQQYFFNDGRGCYLLSDDDYPHRIPKRNDEEQLRVYKEAGEDGLRGYLGTKKEIDFARINEVLAAFHEGKDTITLRHLERKDGEISSEETDFSGISVLLLEWTHGGSDDLHGVDLSVFLESSPEETKEPRRECRKSVYLPCGGTGTGKTRSAAQKCRMYFLLFTFCRACTIPISTGDFP